MDDDALVLEAHLRLLSLRKARGRSTAAKIIAPIRAIEQLVIQRSLQRLCRDFYLDSMSRYRTNTQPIATPNKAREQNDLMRQA